MALGITFNAGNRVTATDLQAMVDQIDTNTAASAPLTIFDAVQTVAQSVPNATDTPITFTTENVDSDASHSTSSNTSRVTPITAGWYAVLGQVGYANGSATNRRGAKILKNGSVVNGTQILVSSGDDTGILSVATTALVSLNGTTDYLELAAIQDSGGAMNTATGAEACRLTVILIRRT